MEKISTVDLMRWARTMASELEPPLNRLPHTYGLALRVLYHYMGTDWVNQCIGDMDQLVSARNRSARRHLHSDAEATEDRYRCLEHTLQLAQLIHNLQGTEGLEERIRRFRAGEVEAISADLHCAGLLRKAGLSFRFVQESGVRSRDYDGEVALAGGQKLNCEFKGKADQTALTVGTLRSTFRHCKSQLPEQEPGIILVKIPEAWPKQADGEEVVRTALQELFRNSTRANAVVFRWADWQFFTDRSEIKWSFKIEPNTASRFLTPEIHKIPHRISNPPAHVEWDDFRQIAALA